MEAGVSAGACFAPDQLPSRLFRLQPQRIFGRYSYGFYTYHLIWFAPGALCRVCGAELHSTVMGTTLVMAVNAFVMFLVAKLSYNLFEVHWLRIKVQSAYDAETVEQWNSLDLNQRPRTKGALAVTSVSATQRSKRS